jgi:protein-disulfide isomerase
LLLLVVVLDAGRHWYRDFRKEVVGVMKRAKSMARSRFWLAALFLTIVLPIAPCFAEQCKGPTAEKQAQLSDYVMKRYHFDPAGKLLLLENAQADDACFWKLHYQSVVATTGPSGSRKMDVTVYLSPDGQYLVPNLYDLRIDPLNEEKARAEKLINALVADDPPSQGPENAPITIVEFSDFQCPYCKRMSDVLEKELTVEEKKNIRVVFRQYPLAMHAWAKPAAEVAGCAALQSNDAFWKVNDYMFANQASLTADNVREKVAAFITANAGVDKVQFDKCMDKKLSAGGVAQDVDLGNKNGVHVTPTLFINGTKYDGAKDLTQLRAIISGIQKTQQQEIKAVDTKVAVAK